MIGSLTKLDEARNKKLLERLALKHLAGKHDQRTHGRGGGPSAPRDSLREKQKQAWELHEQGKTWEEVAKLAGYANGGAARKAGLLHKKRLDEEGGGGGGTDKPDETPTPKPKEVVTPQEGAAAIAQARAVIDKATGGRPVADVLADERAGTSSFVGGTATAKEREIELAVTEAGRILNAEVERRIDLEAGATLRRIKTDQEAVKLEREKVRADDLEVRRDEFKFEQDTVKPAVEGELKKMRDEPIISRYGEMYTPIAAVRRGAPMTQLSDDEIDADLFEIARTLALPQDGTGVLTGKSQIPWEEAQRRARAVAKKRYPNPADKRQRDAYRSTLEGVTYTMHNEARQRVLDNNPSIQAGLGDLKRRREAVGVRNRGLIDREVLFGRAVREAMPPERRAQIVTEVLTEAGRTFSTKPGQRLQGTKALQAELRDELVKIPDQLWDSGKFPDLKVKAVKSRGHWSRYKQEIATDGSGDRRASTLLHEATHAVEDMFPAVKQLQFIMFERRAKGEAPQQLSKLIPGSRYGRDEKAVKDEWTSPYSGKRYGTTRSASHEIMTMGIESLFRRGGYPGEIADPDHLNFVMGVLAFA